MLQVEYFLEMKESREIGCKIKTHVPDIKSGRVVFDAQEGVVLSFALMTPFVLYGSFVGNVEQDELSVDHVS